MTAATDKDTTSPYYNSTWQTTVIRTYANDTGTNCMGLPLTASVTNVVPGQTTRTRSYGFSVNTSACRVEQQVIEPNTAALKVTTTLGFDTCGNVNSVQVTGSKPDGTAMTPRTTGFNFGTRCQLPETVTNTLNQSTTLAYRYDFGVPGSATDPNQVSTSWQYDDFGRRTLETRPDGTWTTWSFESCSVGPCWGIGDLRFKVIETPYDTGGVPIKAHHLLYDGLDRLRYDEGNRVLGDWTRTSSVRPLIRRITQFNLTRRDQRLRHTVLRRPEPGDRARLYDSGGALDRTTRK